jgi:hypothetical protein
LPTAVRLRIVDPAVGGVGSPAASTILFLIASSVILKFFGLLINMALVSN